jgi:hypothetical protein
VAHNKAYGHIEAVRGKPKVDEDGKVIKDEKTCIILLYNLIPFNMPPSPSADNPDEPSTIAHW